MSDAGDSEGGFSGMVGSFAVSYGKLVHYISERASNTLDSVPRQSIIGKIVNYSPGIFGCGIVVYGLLGYFVMGCVAWSELPGGGVMIVLLPLIFIAVLAVPPAYWAYKAQMRFSAAPFTVLSRTFAFLAVVAVISVSTAIIPSTFATSVGMIHSLVDPASLSRSPAGFGGILFFLVLYVTSTMATCVLYLSTIWRICRELYLEYRCRSAFSGHEEALYGRPVLLSMPLHKLCGHFVIVVGEYKYELRLVGNARAPQLLHGTLREGDLQRYRDNEALIFSPLGWTQFSHDEIVKRLQVVSDNFGTYHLFKNNCRHFLVNASESILHVYHATFPLGNLASKNPYCIILLYQIYLMKESLQEFFLFAVTSIYGHGKLPSLETAPGGSLVNAYLGRPHRLSRYVEQPAHKRNMEDALEVSRLQWPELRKKWPPWWDLFEWIFTIYTEYLPPDLLRPLPFAPCPLPCDSDGEFPPTTHWQGDISKGFRRVVLIMHIVWVIINFAFLVGYVTGASTGVLHWPLE